MKTAEQLETILTTTERWPLGLFGDAIGGRSFSDEQSEVLLATAKRTRPKLGGSWGETWIGGVCYTTINTRPETADEVAEMEAIRQQEERQ